MDRLYQAFIVRQDEKNGPLMFFAKIWDTREVARVGLFVAQVVTFDGVLVRDPFVLPCHDWLIHASCFQLFRTYIIWGRNLWVTVVPAITLTGTVGELFLSPDVEKPWD